MVSVTTSWDDGDALDRRLADLLDRYQIKGTFYVTKQYRGNRLSEDDIRALSIRHEIGAHTLTHPELPHISSEQKKVEIFESKKWLEGVLGREVPMFCYPKGLHDPESVELVKAAGFLGARTTELGKININDPFLVPTTLQVYPMPFRKTDVAHYWWGKLFDPYIKRQAALRALGVSLTAFRSFESLACATFDQVHKKGGIFHLWGHSWEIERYGMWDELERVLRYVGKRKDCEYGINGQLL